jgi:glycosyltransferase involved in cell wall biosynthesis
VFNKSLTIVLPVHNAESRLRKNVRELLELASDLTARFGVLIIDDGSTDSTLEVAEELAAYFPQVTVRRHRQCLGLGASLEYVQRRVRSDAVIVHDGITPVNSQEVRKLWRQWLDESKSRDRNARASATPSRDAVDLADLQSIHASLERAHRQVIGFQLLDVSQFDAEPAIETASKSERPRTDATHAQMRPGVGRIPALPRPKFLSALAEFALGE